MHGWHHALPPTMSDIMINSSQYSGTSWSTRMVGNYVTQFLNILARFTQGHAFHKKHNALLPSFLKVITVVKNMEHFLFVWCRPLFFKIYGAFNIVLGTWKNFMNICYLVCNAHVWRYIFQMSWRGMCSLTWPNTLKGLDSWICTPKFGVCLTTLLPMSWWLTSSLFIPEAFLTRKII